MFVDIKVMLLAFVYSGHYIHYVDISGHYLSKLFSMLKCYTWARLVKGHPWAVLLSQVRQREGCTTFYETMLVSYK